MNKIQLNIFYYILIVTGFFTVTLSHAFNAPNQELSNRMENILLDDLERASEKLHFEAKRNVNDAKYWEAARDLIILLDFYPDYSQIDDAVFILGDCLYEIGIMDGATRIYRYLVKKFIRSPLLPRALLGLQRIEYDTGNYARCIEFYNAIVRGTPEQDVLDVSRYYAGQSYYSFKDYPNAIKIIDQINENSPYYDYGHYTKALALLRMKQIRQAVKSFRLVCKLPVVSDERRAVVDESHLTLGYLYYELGFNEHALAEFRSVSSSHNSYDEALIAEAWSAINLNKHNEAIPPLTRLISLFPENDTSEEAFFLLGKSYLKIDMFEEALRVYEHLLAIFPEKEMVPSIVREVNLSLTEEKIKIEKIKMDLLVMESRLLDSIPFEKDGKLSAYLNDEKQKIAETRMALLKQIQTERKTFASLSDQMQQLQSLAERRESRRDWRAYAQYGKSRALFLINKEQ
jgi:tetratricopeptide (TPR) repeat protein